MHNARGISCVQHAGIYPASVSTTFGLVNILSAQPTPTVEKTLSIHNSMRTLFASFHPAFPQLFSKILPVDSLFSDLSTNTTITTTMYIYKGRN